jgi:hypothetical protein
LCSLAVGLPFQFDVEAPRPGLTLLDVSPLDDPPKQNDAHGQRARQDLLDAIRSWESEVKAIEVSVMANPRESSMHDYDYVAALYSRNGLEAELIYARNAWSHVPEIAATELLDKRFSDVTDGDDHRMMATILREMRVPVEHSVGWWWRRVPRRGRARDELEGAMPPPGDISDRPAAG